jgi:hypothetical protein
MAIFHKSLSIMIVDNKFLQVSMKALFLAMSRAKFSESIWAKVDCVHFYSLYKFRAAIRETIGTVPIEILNFE